MSEQGGVCVLLGRSRNFDGNIVFLLIAELLNQYFTLRKMIFRIVLHVFVQIANVKKCFFNKV